MNIMKKDFISEIFKDYYVKFMKFLAMQGIQEASVQYIITSTVNALENNPERRSVHSFTFYLTIKY